MKHCVSIRKHHKRFSKALTVKNNEKASKKKQLNPLTRRRISLIILTLFLMVTGNPIARAAKDGVPYAVSVQDGQAVWMAYGNSNWDIYHQDLTTQAITQITHHPSDQCFPTVHGQYMVWLDNRDRSDRSDYDVYLYNLMTKSEKKLSVLAGKYESPVIEGQHVFWIYKEGIEESVKLYDISTETVKTISSAGATPIAIKAQGNYVLWSDARNGNMDIYLYALDTETEKQITNSPADEYNFYIDKEQVIWTVAYNGVHQIYGYDIGTGYTSRITNGQTNHMPLAFSDGNVIMKEEGQIIKTNTESSVSIPLDIPITGDVKGSFLEGDNLIWFDGTSFEEDTLSQSISRVETNQPNPNEPDPNQPEPNQPDPNQPNSHASQQENTSTNSQDDSIIVEDSYTIIMDVTTTLMVNKGTYHHIHHNKETQPIHQKNYQQHSDLYTWKIDQANTSKAQYTMVFKMDKKDNKKIWPFIIKDNRILPLQGTRNQANNTITVTIPSEGKIALMTYTSSLKDIHQHWAKDTIELLTSRRIIEGYADATFRPDKAISRSEFIAMLTKSMEGEQEVIKENKENKEEEVIKENEEAKEEGEEENKGENQEANKEIPQEIFTDVSEEHWALPYITTAYNKGWVKGNANHQFAPDENITREQLITILMRIYNQLEPEKNHQEKTYAYEDSDQISAYAKAYVEQGIELGLLQGYDHKLAPQKTATRAETATLLSRFLQLFNRL